MPLSNANKQTTNHLPPSAQQNGGTGGYLSSNVGSTGNVYGSHGSGGGSNGNGVNSNPLRTLTRALPLNLENDMYYTVDFSDSQNSPLIQWDYRC